MNIATLLAVPGTPRAAEGAAPQAATGFDALLAAMTPEPGSEAAAMATGQLSAAPVETPVVMPVAAIDRAPAPVSLLPEEMRAEPVAEAPVEAEAPAPAAEELPLQTIRSAPMPVRQAVRDAVTMPEAVVPEAAVTAAPAVAGEVPPEALAAVIATVEKGAPEIETVPEDEASDSDPAVSDTPDLPVPAVPTEAPAPAKQAAALPTAAPVTAENSAPPVQDRGTDSASAERADPPAPRMAETAAAQPDRAAPQAMAGEGADTLPSSLFSQALPGSQRAAAPAQPYGATPAAAPPPAQPPVVAAQPGRMGRDMGVEIARNIAAGREEVMIRLDPAELGRIDVRLSFDREGSLRAVMAADSASALDMLRREAGDLTRALGDAGVRTDQQSFRFDSRGQDSGQSWQRGQQQGDAQQRPGGGRQGSEQALSDGNIQDEPVYRRLGASGRVDMMA